VEVRRWDGCASGSALSLTSVAGAGHSRLGSVEDMGLGPTSQTFSNSGVLLDSIVDPSHDHLVSCAVEGSGTPGG